MSTIIFSDAHLTLRDPYGLKDFRERALRDVLTAGAKADMIIDAGDMFHARYFDSELMAWVTNIYTECLGREISKLCVLEANHDANSRTITAFTAYANGVRCYGSGPLMVGRWTTKRDKFDFRGWNSNEKIETANDYLVTHLRVKEWTFDNPERAFSLAEIKALPYKRIFTGDLHQHKTAGKITSIGTLCSSSFADKDVESGYLIFDEDQNKYIRKTFAWYPIFRTIEIYEDIEFEPRPEYIKGNIIKLRFIGSPKFVQDKIIKQKWFQTIWSMEPHHLEDDFEQTTPEIAVSVSQIPIEEEIKQAAIEQKWPEGSDDVAIAEMTK